MTAAHAKLAVGVLIVLTVAVVFVFYRRVNPWWWSLRKSTRVLIAVAYLAVIAAVGVWHQLTIGGP